MAVKLHRCQATFLRFGGHPCWRVQKALDDADVDYEVVKHPQLRFMRSGIEELSGQKRLPVIELEDGTIIREESRDMVDRIREGKLKSGGIGGIFKRSG